MLYAVLDAGYIILRLLETGSLSLKNGGWALNTLGLFIMGPQVSSVRQTLGQPWGCASSSEGSSLVPQSAQHHPTKCGVCDRDTKIQSEVDAPSERHWRKINDKIKNCPQRDVYKPTFLVFF